MYAGLAGEYSSAQVCRSSWGVLLGTGMPVLLGRTPRHKYAGLAGENPRHKYAKLVEQRKFQERFVLVVGMLQRSSRARLGWQQQCSCSAS